MHISAPVSIEFFIATPRLMPEKSSIGKFVIAGVAGVVDPWYYIGVSQGVEHRVLSSFNDNRLACG
jgi:hypothetical protein